MPRSASISATILQPPGGSIVAKGGTASVSGEFVSSYDENKKKYVTVKASGSATLVPVDEDHGEVFIYLTPKGMPPHVSCLAVQWPE